MDLYKLTLLLCLLFAIREAHGIFWNKHIGDLGDLRSLIPLDQIDGRLGTPIRRKLPNSQELGFQGHLQGLNHLRPNTGEWASKITYKTTKPSPKGEIDHRDDQSLLQWTKGCDGNIIEIPHEFVHGLNDKHLESDMDKSHEILHKVHEEIHETTPVGIESFLGDESVHDERIEPYENSTKPEEGNLRLAAVDENGENIIYVQIKNEPTPLVNNNSNEATNNTNLEKALSDGVEVGTTEQAYVSTWSDANVEAEPANIAYDTDFERKHNKSKDSVVKSVDLEEPIVVSYRSFARENPTVPVVKLQRIPKTQKRQKDLTDRNQELFNKLKQAQWKIKSRNKYRLNLAALRNTRYNLATPKGTLQSAPEIDRYRSNSDSRAEPKLIDSTRLVSSIPYGAQQFYGFPGPNMFTPQQYDTGSIRNSGAASNFRYPSLHQDQDLSPSYLAKQQQGLYGYDQNVPTYNMNTMSQDPNSFASLSNQSPYADSFPSGASQFGDVQYRATAPPPAHDVLPAGNRWFLNN